MKTSELTGHALDWAVAKCEFVGDLPFVSIGGELRSKHEAWHYHPSTDWAQGGPIIEREGIGVYRFRGAWAAHCPLPNGGFHACMENQPTPLIAAMRCYVASKLGDEVDVPELLQGESK
jgi:hypothetical protein